MSDDDKRVSGTNEPKIIKNRRIFEQQCKKIRYRAEVRIRDPFKILRRSYAWTVNLWITRRSKAYHAAYNNLLYLDT